LSGCCLFVPLVQVVLSLQPWGFFKITGGTGCTAVMYPFFPVLLRPRFGENCFPVLTLALALALPVFPNALSSFTFWPRRPLGAGAIRITTLVHVYIIPKTYVRPASQSNRLICM